MNTVVAAAIRDAETIRETAREVLAREEFDLSDYEQDGRLSRIGEFLEWLWDRLLNFSQVLEGLPTPWRVILYVVSFGLLGLLIWHIAYTMSRGLRVTRRAARDSRGGGSRDPRELERRAEAASGNGDFVEAVRLLFRAAIIRLENVEHRTNRPGVTNRELLIRYRSTAIHSALRQLVDVLDRSWYGGQECGATEFESCRDAHEAIRSRARQALSSAPGARSSPPVRTAT